MVSIPPTYLSPSKIEDSRSHFSKDSIPHKRFSEFPLYPRKVMKDSHSPQKLSKLFSRPTSHQGFSIPNIGPRISLSQQSKIFNLQAVSKDFSSSTIKDFLESPASVKIYFPRQHSKISLSPVIKDLFSSARQLISLHTHTLHSYIDRKSVV